ncbi:MAG: 4Fe-4S cluster-binding domain-containing protein [Candidatus Omnitrophica bacterium]|nr:4Fe-4S cluster-binding domain-containing protein [Candidatus Omnitrophota bacterium]
MSAPAYLKSYEDGRLKENTKKAFSLLESCTICPRKCKVNRLEGKLGFCKTGQNAAVYSFLAHQGEEPPISGNNGSGTIFFSQCNMACVYCQNYKFSQIETGKETDSKELAKAMLQLQTLGCHNINLVTPTHVMPQILKALLLAISSGLKIPLCYNSSGYELPEIITLLDGVIDIYLADLRYADTQASLKYSNAPDYPSYSQAAIKEMHRQVGIPKFDKQGIIERGLIIRHLVLPNNISGTEEIMRFIASELSPETYISLMSQYLPCHKADSFPELSRRIIREEYRQAKKTMQKYGLKNGWTQEGRGLDSLAGTNIKPIH